MPLTPEDVANKQFTSTRLKPGYDETEVDEFLDEVEAELTRLYRENDELRSSWPPPAAARPRRTQAPAPAAPAAPAAPDPAVARENEELKARLPPPSASSPRPANRPAPQAPAPAAPAAAPARAERTVRDRDRHPGAGPADRRRAHRRGAHPGRPDRRRGPHPRRAAQAGGRGQAPADDRLPGDRALRPRARGREAALLRARVPQPAQVLPGGPAARARRPRQRGTGRSGTAGSPQRASPAPQGQQPQGQRPAVAAQGRTGPQPVRPRRAGRRAVAAAVRRSSRRASAATTAEHRG